MRCIDFHTHNFPATLAPRALAVMCEKLEPLARGPHGPLVPSGDGTVDTQLRAMDSDGIDYDVNCPVATRPEHFDAILRRADAVRSGKEGAAAAARIVQLGSVHPADPDFIDRLCLLRQYGFPGIKIHPNYQGVRLDDPDLVPFFTAVRDAGLFVISHTGFDPGYLDVPPVADPAQIEALLKAVPGLTFVAAHLGGECGVAAHEVDRLLPFENCLLDTAVMYFRDDADEARRLVREWPANRLVFGTDYFWRNQAKLRRWVAECRPDAADQEKIFHLNAEKLLGGLPA